MGGPWELQRRGWSGPETLLGCVWEGSEAWLRAKRRTEGNTTLRDGDWGALGVHAFPAVTKLSCLESHIEHLRRAWLNSESPLCPLYGKGN